MEVLLYLVHQLGCKDGQCFVMVERPEWGANAETAWSECSEVFGGHLAHIKTFSLFTWIRRKFEADVAVLSSCNVRECSTSYAILRINSQPIVLWMDVDLGSNRHCFVMEICCSRVQFNSDLFVFDIKHRHHETRKG